MPEIAEFLLDEDNLKNIIRITKETDSVYLEKRNIPEEYNPLERYSFESWRLKFDDEIKQNYETLHLTLLYTDEKQNWNEVVDVFNSISEILKNIDE